MRDVASIEALTAAVRGALCRMAEACQQVTGTHSVIEAAGRTYHALGEGSDRQDLDTAAAFMEHALDLTMRATAEVNAAMERATCYLAAIEGSGVPTTLTDRPVEACRRPWQLGRDRVDALREELPPPVPQRQRGTRQKTHGRWVGSDGVPHAITSGADDNAQLAERTLGELGIPGMTTRTSDVEMKLAAMLRIRHTTTGEPQHVSVVLNQAPCRGPRGCDTLVPVLLPEGCTLTVHRPNMRKTYTGGARPWWH
jgi:hypothetical protein